MTYEEAKAAALESPSGYFSAKDDKQNLTLKTGGRDWYKMENVSLGNGSTGNLSWPIASGKTDGRSRGKGVRYHRVICNTLQHPRCCPSKIRSGADRQLLHRVAFRGIARLGTFDQRISWMPIDADVGCVKAQPLLTNS